MYLVLFLVMIILILLLINYFLIYKIKKISFLNRISNKLIKKIIYIIPLIVFIIFLFIDAVNIVVVYLYLTIFLLLFDFLNLIIRKVLNKEINYDLIFFISILTAILYLSHAYFLAHNVVETKYNINSNKDIGVEKFRIVQISDSHIGTTFTGDEFLKYVEKINLTNPDIVVVTGDYIDDDTGYEDMKQACISLGKLKTKYGIYFIYGNHDKGYFKYRTYNDSDLIQELKNNNVIILNDKVQDITNNIVLIGRNDSQNGDRLTASQLTSNIDKNKYIIMLDHKPNDYKNEANSKVDLVLSGHTHGGQLFPLGQIAVLLGINDNRYGLKKIQNTNFIVNSGISDWNVKFKTGTKSEYVVIDIFDDNIK